MTPGQFSAGSSFNGNGGPAVFYPSGANRSALTFLGGFLKSALDNRECCGWSATQPRSVGKVKTRFANRLRGGLVHDNTIRRINSFACARSKRRRAAALQDASRPASHNLSRQRLGVRPALWRFFSKPTIQKTFNAKTPRCKVATVSQLLVPSLDVTIWLSPAPWVSYSGVALPAWRLCVEFRRPRWLRLAQPITDEHG